MSRQHRQRHRNRRLLQRSRECGLVDLIAQNCNALNESLTAAGRSAVFDDNGIATSGNGREARATYRHIPARNRQRWLSNLVYSVGKHVLLPADPLVCIGDYRATSTLGGTRGGGIPYTQMVDALCRNFICLDVPEPYSSKNAPTTGVPVRLATQLDLDGRQPRQRNRVFAIDGSLATDGIHTLLDHDVSAGLNMVQLALNQLARDRRPAAFTAVGQPAVAAVAGAGAVAVAGGAVAAVGGAAVARHSSR